MHRALVVSALTVFAFACGPLDENEEMQPDPMNQVDGGVEETVDAGEEPYDGGEEFDGGSIEEEEMPPDAGPRPDGGTPPKPDAGTVCVEYAVTHAQASMQHTDSSAELRTAIGKAFAPADGVLPDSISWTEIETQAQIDLIEARAGWTTYWPFKNAAGKPVVHPANAVPVSFRDSVYTFIAGTSTKASDGKAGVSPHRYVNRVRLRHQASGTEVVRIAHHSVSGIDTLNDNVAYRTAAHKQNMVTFNRVMNLGTVPVIGSGDFNTVRLRTKLAAEGGKFVYDVPAKGGSHGNRLIDWVVRRVVDGKAYELQSVAFLDLTPSDHRGVRARYKYRPAPCK